MNGKLRDGVEKLRKFIKENGGGSDLIEILESLIFKDQLTGLYNKNFFNESLPGELSLAFRDGKPLSLVILDNDNLKEINDKYGLI